MNSDEQQKESSPLAFQVDGRSYTMEYDQAFAYADTLLRGQFYQQAEGVLRTLAAARPEDRAVKVMQARCYAGLGNYPECDRFLKEAFGESEEAVVRAFHAAFVSRAFNKLNDALKSISKAVQQRSDLAVAYLIGGDMFAAANRPKKAAACWRLAIEKATPGSPVVKAAQEQLQKQRGQTTPDGQAADVRANEPAPQSGGKQE